tara:strand:- start:540 stop:1385 length:846 start_codon:yes stop_codon:yes gene_type:complete
MNPFKSKKGLGRGLSSLIGDSDINIKNNNLSISSIISNQYQPRKNFDKESLQELSNSIKERGVIQPLIVRKSVNMSKKYELIAGERRMQAAQLAGLHEVPVLIIEANNLKSLELAIIENVQRKDLNPIEEAKSYQRLINEFNYDQEKVSKFIGKSRPYISNSLRLLSLPDYIIKLLEEDKITSGHAKILVGLSNSEVIAKKIISKKLSVRQTESLVNLLKNSKNKIFSKDVNILNLEKSLKEKIGINVLIKNKKNNSGQLLFEYKDLDQLNRLIMVIKANY